jgi:glycosyltransferase involved in cell wall biosynthesis
VLSSSQVCVIIAARNAESFIQETLESFRGLDHILAIVVVHDHSTDGTLALVQGLVTTLGLPLRVIDADGKQALGAAESRNLGTHTSLGDILRFF